MKTVDILITFSYNVLDDIYQTSSKQRNKKW